MKISYNWLKQYIDVDYEPKVAAEVLTMIGLEVEGIELHQTVKGGLAGLVIGEVKTCIKHPNSDHLSITTVDVGAENLLNIVCGAPNVAAGQKVVVATIGTVLYNGDESITIKKGKIRGEVSEGMICAEDEIGLGESHDGIMILPETAIVGSLAKDFFNIQDEYIFEIAILPNHIDAASHYGVARDLAAFLSQTGEGKLNRPSVDAFAVDNHNLNIAVEVAAKEACPRYSGVSITGVKVGASPEWLQERLKAIGLKPINNIVDITNFVLHELGQPLHAFDADKIKGNKVIVNTLAEGTKFVTLDAQERKLRASDLMICNAEEPMCIAGVFGGLESGVSEATQNIFLESAYFDAGFVRKTSKHHLLNTDASFRFERGTDPNGTILALKRAALLIKEIAGGSISSEISDYYPNPVADFRIETSYGFIDRLIGKQIGKEKIDKILTSLEIKIVSDDNDQLILDVPPYRVDVRTGADIVEEVLRIYGLNNIEVPTVVKSSIQNAIKPDDEKLRNLIADLLTSRGFYEAWTNSITKAAYYDLLESYKADNLAKIVNPLSSDLNAMRQTLLFGGLESIANNINHRNLDVKLYEFGKVYTYDATKGGENPLSKFNETKRLALFLTGKKNPLNWKAKEEAVDFYFAKNQIDAVLQRLNIKPEQLVVDEINDEIFAYGLSYTFKNKTVARFGAVSAKILKRMDVDADVFYADFDWEFLLKSYSPVVSYKELPKFPAVRRDLALLVDKTVKFSQLKEIAYKTERNLLKDVTIFDVYEGKNLAADKKSYALSFTLQDTQNTLNDKQIEKTMSNLIKNYEQQLGASLR